MRQDAWRAYLEMALGLTEASRKKATKAVKRALGKGGATAEQLQEMADELLKTSAANREAMTKLVRYELDRALGRVGLATAEEVSELTARVRQLEAELAQTRAARDATGPAPAVEPFDDDEGIRIIEPAVVPVAEPGASEPLATVTPIASGAGAGARKAVAKKAVKKASPAKSVPAKSVPAKSVPAKSATAPAEADVSTAPAPARKAAKKTAAKKATPADIAPAGAEAVASGAADAAPGKAADAAPSSPAKKAPGRKAATNRAPAKKAPPKKTPARRSGDGGAGT
jgi:polyhydroxyalkanoate synthesis regulator phasin